MRDFVRRILGVISVIGIGKIIYDKGRRDEARNISDKIDIAYAGIEIGEKREKEKNKEESK